MLIPSIRKTQIIVPLAFCATSLAYAANSPSPEIEKWCTLLSTDLRSVKKDNCLNTPWKVEGHSTQNNPIPFTKWGNESGKKIMILGSIHGDEISSVSICFRWLELLKSQPENSELKKNHFFIAPLINIDGYIVRPRTRTNANKVDINRNFKTGLWDSQAIALWKLKSKSDPRRFPGSAGGSEVETQLIQKWIEEYKPDLIISVHAPYGLIDHDGPMHFESKNPTNLPVKTLGAFPGSLGQYAGVEKSIPVVTVELKTAMQVPDQKMIEKLLEFVSTANKK